MKELLNHCIWKETEINGVKGMKITGTNGNSIFLPAAGAIRGKSINEYGKTGIYMNGSSSIYTIIGYLGYFSNKYGDTSGISVRPVIDLDNPVTVEEVILNDDKTYCQYNQNTDTFKIHYFFNIKLKPNISIGNNNILNYGVVLYRDNVIYKEIICSGNEDKIEVELDSSPHYMNIKYEAGKYTATT